MKTHAIFGLMVAGSVAFAAGTGSVLASSATQMEQGGAKAASHSVDDRVRVASSCGWYAISVCSKRQSSAQRGANRYGGYVIHTSDPGWPNFRNGWFCAVEGPLSKRDAQAEARYMRSLGASTAYAKNAC